VRINYAGGCRLTCFVLFSFLFLPFIFAPPAQAGGAGVGVLNIPPEYKLTEIVSAEDALEIHLIVTDYNSWKDIQGVRVEIRDREDLTAIFTYNQYAEDSSERIDEFRNIVGSALISKRCTVIRNTSSDNIMNRCCLDLRFVFYPVPGDSVRVILRDKQGEEAVTHIQYSRGFGGLPVVTGALIIPVVNKPIPVSEESVNIFISALSVTVLIAATRVRWGV